MLKIQHTKHNLKKIYIKSTFIKEFETKLICYVKLSIIILIKVSKQQYCLNIFNFYQVQRSSTILNIKIIHIFHKS